VSWKLHPTCPDASQGFVLQIVLRDPLFSVTIMYCVSVVLVVPRFLVHGAQYGSETPGISEESYVCIRARSGVVAGAVACMLLTGTLFVDGMSGSGTHE